jgi:hypothetical protein
MNYPKFKYHFLAAAAALALASSHCYLADAKSLSKIPCISSGLNKLVLPRGPSDLFLFIYGPGVGSSPLLNFSRRATVFSGVKSFERLVIV